MTARHPALLRSTQEIRDWVEGGRSTLTIKNRMTGVRATYRIEAREDGFDVLAFTGQDNAHRSHYTLMGRLEGGQFRARGAADVVADLADRISEAPKGHWVDHRPGFLAKCAALLGAGRTLTKGMAWRFRGALGKYGVPGWVDDPVKSVIFPWTWHRIASGKDLPEAIEVWHEGGCRCCGKRLTVPASIELGMGPDCAKVHGRLDDWHALNVKLGADLDAYLRSSGRIPSDS